MGETIGKHFERKGVASRPSPLKDGRGPAQGPGWRESAIQRFAHRQKRCTSRGTGTVMVTGS